MDGPPKTSRDVFGSLCILHSFLLLNGTRWGEVRTISRDMENLIYNNINMF